VEKNKTGYKIFVIYGEFQGGNRYNINGK